MLEEDIIKGEPLQTDFLTQVHLFESVDDTTTEFHPNVVGRQPLDRNDATNKGATFKLNGRTSESRRENLSGQHGGVRVKRTRTQQAGILKRGNKGSVGRTQPGTSERKGSRCFQAERKNTTNTNRQSDPDTSTIGETIRSGVSITVPSSSEDSSNATSPTDVDQQANEAQSHSGTKAVSNVIAHLEHALKEEREQTMKLQSELNNIRNKQADREMELRSSYDAELFRLQTMITRLQTTRASMEPTTRSCSPGTQSPRRASPQRQTVRASPRQARSGEQGEVNEQVIKLKREIEHQDELIAGYQRENERLYAEVKQLSKDHQPDREIIQTAERLANENASLRMEVERMEKENCQRAKRLEELLMADRQRDQTNRLAELENTVIDLNAQLKASLEERNTARLEVYNTNQKIHQLTVKQKQLTEALEMEREQNRVEREKMLEKHRDVVQELQRKLQWYLENQAMVNRDQAKLQAQVKEMGQLRKQLAETQAQSAMKISPIRICGESQPIGDNNWQEPNSMVLQHRIKSLEAELEQAQEREKRAIRSLQQQYETVKNQYEERIKTLLQQKQHREPSSVLRRSVEVQTAGSELRPWLSTTAPFATWHHSVEFDSDGSQTIQNLLLKLRGQIGHLKHELADRQRAIDELQRMSSLNKSAGSEAQGTAGTTRYTRAQRLSGAPQRTPRTAAFVHIPPRQINTLPPQKSITQKRPMVARQTKATRLDDLEANVTEVAAARLALQERIVELENRVSEQQRKDKREDHIVTREATTLTDNAWIAPFPRTNQNLEIRRLEKELDRQTCLIVQLQSELNTFRRTHPSQLHSLKRSNENENIRAHDHCMKTCQELTNELIKERERCHTLERQLATLKTIHQVTGTDQPVNQAWTQLFDQLCAAERGSHTNQQTVRPYTLPNTQYPHWKDGERWPTLANNTVLSSKLAWSAA